MKSKFGADLICPRCNGEKFDEHESGPDSYDDDIIYTSYSCNNCHLWFSDWTGKWYKDCTNWQEEEAENEYKMCDL